jgi:hypothetical protein
LGLLGLSAGRVADLLGTVDKFLIYSFKLLIVGFFE